MKVRSRAITTGVILAAWAMVLGHEEAATRGPAPVASAEDRAAQLEHRLSALEARLSIEFSRVVRFGNALQRTEAANRIETELSQMARVAGTQSDVSARMERLKARADKLRARAARPVSGLDGVSDRASAKLASRAELDRVTTVTARDLVPIAAAPANDACASATVIGAGTFMGTTVDATNDGSATCGASASSPDVWYRFSAPSSGSFIFDTIGSAFDTVLSVHSGCPGTTGNELACNDDNLDLTSAVSVNLTMGQEILVRVAGFSGDTGAFDLNAGVSGGISGSVLASGTSNVIDSSVFVFDAAGNFVGSILNSLMDGSYEILLPAGTYFVTTGNVEGFLDELYDGNSCPGGFSCDPTTGTPVVVSAGSVTSGIDFLLDKVGFSGTLTDAATSNPLTFSDVDVFDSSGTFVGTFFTDDMGFYEAGVPPGTYFATTFNFDGLIDELYDDISCPGGGFSGCNPTTGTPIVVTSGVVAGIDFALAAGGFSGRITDQSTGFGIPFADVDVFDSGGNYLLTAFGDFDGNYQAGLPAGTYFATTFNFDGYVDELYDDITCPGGGFASCDPTTGTAIAVTSGLVTGNIDFALTRTGFNGTITEDGTGTPIFSDVDVFDSGGNFVATFFEDGTGFYQAGVPPGTYFATTFNFDGFIDELYDDIPCPGGGFGGCDPTTGTAIVVGSGTPTPGIDFALDSGGFAGTITDAGTGFPIPFVDVDVFDSSGNFVLTAFGDVNGEYVAGVPAGNYFATTFNFDGYIDELYDNIVCPGGGFGGCDPTTGTSIAVTAGSVTMGIDFALNLGGFSGTVTSAITGQPIPFPIVDAFDGSGNFVASGFAGADGTYQVGVPAGNYFATTFNFDGFTDELYDDITCPGGGFGGCDPTLGDAIVVSMGTVTPGIDFALDKVVVLDPIPSPIVVGATNTLFGSGFTAGSVIKLFVARASGPLDLGPFTPTSWNTNQLTWDVDPTIPLGNGFGTVLIVNTDENFILSNTASQLLYGDAADNIPTILSINSVPLSPVAQNIPVANVETVVSQGASVDLTGTGFNAPLVNFFTAAGNLGPITPSAVTPTSMTIVVPAGAPTGPASFQVVNNPFTGNVLSNAVSAVIGSLVTVTNVSQVGTTVTVTGTGFSTLSVINFFNLQGMTVVNLGGLDGSGNPKIPLNFVSELEFSFTVPVGAQSGPAFVQVLNPPFIPFSSSGNDPDGAFTLAVP